MGTGAHPVSCRSVQSLLPRLKHATNGFQHPPQSSTEVQEREELYFYSPYVPAWKVTGTYYILDYILKIFKRSSTEDAGRDNVVGIATHCGPDGLGIKPWWELDFTFSLLYLSAVNIHICSDVAPHQVVNHFRYLDGKYFNLEDFFD
jgi:hypothetical protein